MQTPRFAVWMLSIGVMVPGVSGVSAQDYPNKAIRIVTGGVGGGGDFLSRLIAQGLTGPLGQPVIVDNRPNITTAEIVAKAPPDGYTLLQDAGSFWMAPLLEKTSYDPIRDFYPVTMLVNSPGILLVHPSLPVKSVKELIALAKAKPGELNYASTAPGSISQLAGELFKATAGVNMVGIPYKGAGPGLTALLGDEVQVMVSTASSAMPHVKSGKLRALAVTSAHPTALVAGLPPVAATVPGFEVVNVNAVFAPAKTPTAVINRLNQEIVRVLNMADVKQKIFDSGAEVVGNSPEEATNKIKSEMSKWGKVLKDAGISAR